MKMQKYQTLLISLILMGSTVAMAAIPNKKIQPSKQSARPAMTLQQQLTGVSRSAAVKVAKMTPSQKALKLARQSKAEKNYILAIKRYNFISKYYPKTAEAKAAFLDKAALYSEMGLEDQARLNNMKAKKISQASAPLSVKSANKVIRK